MGSFVNYPETLSPPAPIPASTPSRLVIPPPDLEVIGQHYATLSHAKRYGDAIPKEVKLWQAIGQMGDPARQSAAIPRRTLYNR